MKVALLLAPSMNAKAMSIEMRKEIGSSNPFTLSKFIGNSVDEIVYLSFLIQELTGDQVVAIQSTLKLNVLKKHMTDSGARYDLIVSGSVAEFQRASISKDIDRLINHYKKQL